MSVVRQIETARIGVFRYVLKQQASAFFALLLFAPIAFAKDTGSHRMAVTLQPENTLIRWTLSDPLHTVHGTFKLKRGVVNFNRDDGSADGLIEVDATSGESGNSVRDARMHKNVLESDRYPVVSFRPTKVIGKIETLRDEDLLVEGLLRIHGADHPLQMHINLHPGGGAITAKTHFSIPYIAWGMKDPSTFILRVNKTVDVDLEATLSESK